MPIQSCQYDGKPGYKWGEQGKCYTYTPGNEDSKKRAKTKAFEQGLAIGDIEEREFRKSLTELVVDSIRSIQVGKL